MKGQRKLLFMLFILLMAGHARAADQGSYGLDDLFLYATSLIGTPYHTGGSSPETGLDCSGFVHHVFMQTIHADLPRSSADMSQQGEPVELSGLQPGDLVFFNTLKRPSSHVGIYLGENRFIHASSSTVGSVTISNLQDEYWSAHYDGARRIVAPLANSNQP
jgi:cell wall-associated NlpC family hydrolase